MPSRGKKKRKARKKKIKLRTLALALLVGGGLLFTSLSLFFLSGRPSKPVAHDECSSRAVSPKKQNSKGEQGARKPQKKESKATHKGEGFEGLPKVAIIIDDVGNDLKLTRDLLDLGVPLTLSILPDLPHSRESEELAHSRGYEVMLHLPMEARGTRSNPGAGAIYHSMTREKVHQVVNNHLGKFSYIKGVNNHMGSLITEDEHLISWVLEVLKPRGLYFIDSRSSSQSVAYEVAHKMGISAGKNKIFLDNDSDVAHCKDVIEKAIQRVKEQRAAIAIGHARRTTVTALKEMNQRIQDEGITLVFVSELVQ